VTLYGGLLYRVGDINQAHQIAIIARLALVIKYEKHGIEK